MAYALYCPLNDTDMTNRVTILFRLDAGPQIPATVALPSVGGAAFEGGVYWAYRASFAGSLLQAVEDALNTADSGPVWNVSLDSSAIPLKVDIVRNGVGGISDWFIDWTDVGSTFDSLLLGFNADITAATTVSVISPFQTGRTWFHKHPPYNPERPRHRGVVLRSNTFNGRSQVVSYGSITYDRDFEAGNNVGPRVYSWVAADPLLFGIVPGLTQGDPNVALDAFVACMCLGRKPIRLVNSIGMSSFIEADLQPQSQSSLVTVDSMIVGRQNAPRYFDLAIPLQEYVP